MSKRAFITTRTLLRRLASSLASAAGISQNEMFVKMFDYIREDKKISKSEFFDLKNADFRFPRGLDMQAKEKSDR